jgi:GNAT superfamily N-acetyltransferase
VATPLSVDDILERTQWDFFWVPPFAEVIDRPELLYVRCERDVTFLNCVTRTRAAPEQLDALVAEVSAAHAGVCSRWLVPATLDTGPLEEALDRGGYAPAYHHVAYAIPVEAYTPRADPGFAVRRVHDRDTLLDCIGVADQAFGSSRKGTESELQFELDACTRSGGRVHRFVVYDSDGAPISSGGLNTYPDLSFGFLWAGGTVPEARGRGAYSALLAARIRFAGTLGFERVGLYARTESSAPVVERHGFARYGPMTYWDRA